MNIIEKFNDIFRVKVRDTIINPIMGERRKRKLKNEDFTIISNNCWAGHVYRYFNLPYNTPTVGLYFYPDEYIRFLSNLKKYMAIELTFVPFEESKYYVQMMAKNEIRHPVGRLDDVEIEFLHYKTEREAYDKWYRRCARINWDHLFVKFSEQNLCDQLSLMQFDTLPYKNKIVFTSKDYGLNSQIIFKEFYGYGSVPNDALHFRKYIDLTKWLNCETVFDRN